MIKSIATIILFALLVCSCGKDDNDNITYPRKFSFNKSEMINEKVFLVGDNESYTEINPYDGYLDSFRNEFILNYYHFIKDSLYSFMIESFEILNKDSIRMEISAFGNSDFYTFYSSIDNIDLGSIDPFYSDSKVYWDKEKQEIKYCQAIALGIVKKANLEYFDMDQNFCTSNDINTELGIFLAEHEYSKNDTLGIYIMDLIYK